MVFHGAFSFRRHKKMRISMQWHLKDNIPVRVGKNEWRQVAMFQPGLWRVDKPVYDLSFLEPDNYEIVIANSKYDVALLSDAVAEIVIYLTENGIKEVDLAIRVVGEKKVLADEMRRLFGSWVYGKIQIVNKPTGKKILKAQQMGANPIISSDKTVYVVPTGKGTIHCFTGDKCEAENEYNKQCGADVPRADLVIAYDSAMKKSAQFGNEERTVRQTEKIQSLLKPGGKGILVAEGASASISGDILVTTKDKLDQAILALDEKKDTPWEQVVLFFDLAYTEIMNIL